MQRSLADSHLRRATALSQREAEIALCVAQGLDNAAIAQKLGIKKGTVAIHLASARIKLRVRNRAHLASVVTLICAHSASLRLRSLVKLGTPDAN